MRPLLLLLALAALAARVTGDEAPLQWRGVWEWSMDKRTDEDLVRIADSCRDLGFNVLMMSLSKDKIGLMADLCHRRGLKLLRSTVFTGGEKDWRQVMTPAEQERAARPLPDVHQHGGEPLTADEVFEGPLPCHSRPEVREYFRKRVAAAAKLPVDGLAFDAVGYANYYRCYCGTCAARLAGYRREHPELSEREASAICAEQAMVEFIDEMAKVARETRPGIELTIHIWPYFRPDPYHGNRVNIDYVGQTVSWFFQPHWPLEKVRRLTKQVVATQHEFHQDSLAAPFIGFYSKPARDLRTAARVQAEIDIVRASGARGIQIAELGHLVRAPDVARVVAACLGGKPEAFTDE